MSYKIFILKRAEKELKKITQSNQLKIRQAISDLYLSI